MNFTPLPQHDDPIITQFKPVRGQWELTEDNINRIDPETGHTILHKYCRYINSTPLEVWRYLIETRGCDINVSNKYKNTPVHDAILFFDPNEGGDITVLHYLLSQNGIDGNIKDTYGYTLLHRACENIHKFPLEIFQHLIETLGCDINAQDDNKNTPLHEALRYFDPNEGGDITVLMYLLSQKIVDVNIKGIDGYSLLHWACSKINTLPLEIFKLLIETKGCDVNAHDNYGDTPIHVAFRYFDPNEGGDITVLTYLLSQKGIDPKIKDKNGYTILHWACEKINHLPLDIFKFLIEKHGCDINVLDRDDNTPLHLAFHSLNPNNDNNITLFAYLINQNNFNLNIKDQDGYTFLHLACICNILDLDDYMDSEDGFSDSEDDWNDLKAKSDTVLSQIVKVIAERCVEQIVNESSS